MSKLEELIQKLCPNGVEYKKLSELGKFYGGLSGKSKNDFLNGNSKFITYMNVYKNIELNLDILESVNVKEDEKQNCIEYGDVIFTGSSENIEDCGMSSVLTHKINEKIYLNSFCFGFRFYNTNLILPSFSKYLFRCDKIRMQIRKTASGVTRFNVSKKKMENVSIPLPPIEIQNEIVRILDNFTELTDEITEKLESELASRINQYKYYSEKVFDFDSISGNVEYKQLREICDFRNGKGHEKDIADEGKYIVVNSKFISTKGKIKKYSNKQICPLYKNDILMVMSDLPNGRALAKCFLVTEDDKYTLNQRIGAFSVKNNKLILNKFLYYVLNRNKQLLRYDNGVDQTNLRKDDILNITIPIPDLEVQRSIIDILDRFDKLCSDMSQNLQSEIQVRKVQYEYYRDKLLTFKELKTDESI